MLARIPEQKTKATQYFYHVQAIAIRCMAIVDPGSCATPLPPFDFGDALPARTSLAIGTYHVMLDTTPVPPHESAKWLTNLSGLTGYLQNDGVPESAGVKIVFRVPFTYLAQAEVRVDTSRVVRRQFPQPINRFDLELAVRQQDNWRFPFLETVAAKWMAKGMPVSASPQKRAVALTLTDIFGTTAEFLVGTLSWFDPKASVAWDPASWYLRKDPYAFVFLPRLVPIPLESATSVPVK
jgi:hypothetical protein